ncbi:MULTISPECIES: SH3 domain-containing protein [unclassified Streptomyces]|uniref:SH3 domain-containing protein n=1 Tax=unclassified Streptomyces TaxID=2593676 RepID=UPI001BE6818E|nr:MULTISPECIES: SH3 domain-containing protein [unclassified Streptomyces]MBT2405205.1 SH3 domain-containing protein [Streptomyces sp. ISL-21]MBT2453384.1 SH3 domain-containing protein [Streptomyces sp. ISL-86]MBT2610973.1 SH3 domain-containing protein [Streptomyces sp. ISL-87]
MLKPTRTILALAAGSLVLGLVGAGVAVADEDPMVDTPSQENVTGNGSDHGWHDANPNGNPSGTTNGTTNGTPTGNAAGGRPGGSSSGTSQQRAATGRVVSRGPLNLRSKPYLGAPVLGTVSPNSTIGLLCKRTGDTVDGNPRWYRLSSENAWVSARYVQNLSTVPACPERS